MGFMDTEVIHKRFPLHRTQQEEKWLEERAREGLHFKKAEDDFYIFERAWGRPAAYKVDIVDATDQERFKISDFVKMEEKMGWRIVWQEGDRVYWKNETLGTVKRYFSIGKYIKRQGKEARAETIAILIAVAIPLFFAVSDDLFSGEGLTPYSIAMICVFALGITAIYIIRERKTFIRYLEIIKLKNRDRRGTYYDRDGSLPEPACEWRYANFAMWEVKEEEKWLEKMAAEGRALEGIKDGAYRFAMMTPAAIQYKVVLPGKGMEGSDPSLKAYKGTEESAGWELLMEAEGRLYWKSTKGIRLEKKYPDIREEAKRSMHGKAGKLAACFLAAAAILAADILPLFMSVHIGGLVINPYSSAMHIFAFLIATITVLINLTRAAVQFAGHVKLKRMAEENQRGSVR